MSNQRLLKLDPKGWQNQLEKKQFDSLSNNFLEILDFFEKNTIYEEIPAQLQFIDEFMHHFLGIFVDAKFKLPKEHINRYILSNPVIANLTAISRLGTTDSHLQRAVSQGAGMGKILTLLNSRCSAKVNRQAFFDKNPQLASLWHNCYSRSYYGALQSPLGYKNLREHFSFLPSNFVLTDHFAEMYFGSTYAGGDLDKEAKAMINRLVRNTIKKIPQKNTEPDPGKIAVISSCWTHGHAVHRCFWKFIEKLKESYHLTLYPSEMKSSTDTSFFDEVIPNMTNNIKNASQICDKNYSAIIFPDIGMSEESIALANMRLAPIQIGLLGHSASTFGAEIDYFFSGASVEITEHPEYNYSERLVLLPGMGVIHEPPRYQFQGLKKPFNRNDPVIINSFSSCQKINYPYIETLLKIIEKIDRNVIFRFFLGASSRRANDHLPFTRDLSKALGSDKVEFFGPMEYVEYMTHVELGDLTIDSFPFGGCNTVSDSLFAQVPMVSWASDRWFGRIGADMLKRAGLSDCAAYTEEEFIHITAKLINDDDYRLDVRERLKGINLFNTIYDTTDAQYFHKAINYLLENHLQLKQDKEQSPIKII